jgi:hypothetical protein
MYDLLNWLAILVTWLIALEVDHMVIRWKDNLAAQVQRGHKRAPLHRTILGDIRDAMHDQERPTNLDRVSLVTKTPQVVVMID